MPAKRDFDTLTEVQLKVFGQISINFDKGHDARTLKALLTKGLIEEREEKLYGHPPVTVKRYVVPTPVHMAWCEWCSENTEDEDG